MLSNRKVEAPINHSEKSKLTSEYKILMDDMLEKHERGELGYSDWEDFKSTLIN